MVLLRNISADASRACIHNPDDESAQPNKNQRTARIPDARLQSAVLIADSICLPQLSGEDASEVETGAQNHRCEQLRPSKEGWVVCRCILIQTIELVLYPHFRDVPHAVSCSLLEPTP